MNLLTFRVLSVSHVWTRKAPRSMNLALSIRSGQPPLYVHCLKACPVIKKHRSVGSFKFSHKAHSKQFSLSISLCKWHHAICASKLLCSTFSSGMSASRARTYSSEPELKPSADFQFHFHFHFQMLQLTAAIHTQLNNKEVSPQPHSHYQQQQQQK